MSAFALKATTATRDLGSLTLPGRRRGPDNNNHESGRLISGIQTDDCLYVLYRWAYAITRQRLGDTTGLPPPMGITVAHALSDRLLCGLSEEAADAPRPTFATNELVDGRRRRYGTSVCATRSSTYA